MKRILGLTLILVFALTIGTDGFAAFGIKDMKKKIGGGDSSSTGSVGSAAPATYKYSDMNKAYKKFHKEVVNPKLQEQSISLDELVALYTKKWGVTFTKSANQSSQAGWGRVAYVAAPGTDPKSPWCLQIYYYYSGSGQGGPGPNGARLNGTGVSSKGCPSAERWGVAIQHPPKL